MNRQLTNNLKFIAQLFLVVESKNETTDRVEKKCEFVRNINFNNIGVTSTDKFTTKDVNEIVKKIEVRLNREIENNQKQFRISISNVMYNIERIYTIEDLRKMEVSLSYDN